VGGVHGEAAALRVDNRGGQPAVSEAGFCSPTAFCVRI
jgi:hypothetical protein